MILKKGDMFESKLIPTITINCKGAMGKGIALTAAQKYPALKVRYKALCAVNYFEPGKPVYLEVNKNSFLLFPTKDHWKYNSKYIWIKKGLKIIRKSLLTLNDKSFPGLSIPPLGCGNGGLDFERVLEMIEEYLGDLDHKIHIYVPENWSL